MRRRSDRFRHVKLDVRWFSSVIGVNYATYYRWLKQPEDQRKNARHPNLQQYSQEHENKVIKYIKLYPDLSVDELIATCLDLRAEDGTPKGYYLGSISYVYRMMHKHNLINGNRTGGKGMRHNINRMCLVAKQPNDVRVWDITYL